MTVSPVETGAGRQTGNPSSMRELRTMFIHTVYFWLKSDAPESAQPQLIADCRDYLSPIPTVRQLWTGAPAHTPRDVVDNSYACGLTVLFDDAAGHDVYQDHPLHQQFIARNEAHWQRVQVYDYTEA